MKTIPVEKLDQRLSNALEGQNEQDVIALTKDENTVAWVLKLPAGMKDTAADGVLFTEGPRGRVTAIIQAKRLSAETSHKQVGKPIFGAGRGTMTVISEDEEHLKDFQEYME